MAIAKRRRQSALYAAPIIKADENDIGKIIGKQGKIAKAIRTIVRSSAMKLGKKVIVEIN